MRRPPSAEEEGDRNLDGFGSKPSSRMATPRRASSRHDSHESHKMLMLGNLSDEPVILLLHQKKDKKKGYLTEADESVNFNLDETDRSNRMEKSAIQTEHARSFMKFGKHGPGNGRWVQEGKVKKPVASRSAKSEGHSSPENEDGGVLALSEKMKELELMDSGDVEHVLDLEEALHYYSFLTIPVFVDIVHKFFMDIYSEFSMARQPTRKKNSKRRFASIEFQMDL